MSKKNFSSKILAMISIIVYFLQNKVVIVKLQLSKKFVNWEISGARYGDSIWFKRVTKQWKNLQEFHDKNHHVQKIQKVSLTLSAKIKEISYVCPIFLFSEKTCWLWNFVKIFEIFKSQKNLSVANKDFYPLWNEFSWIRSKYSPLKLNN